VGGADVDIGLRRHAGVADAVGAFEAPEAVLVRDRRGITQILDQLQRMAEGENLGALDVLDVAHQVLHIAVEREAVAEGVFRCQLLVDQLGALLRHPGIHHRLAVADLPMDFEAAFQVLLLGDLEAHDILVQVRLAVDGKTRRIRPAVLQGLQHRRHFQADVRGPAAVDDSGNSTHVTLASSKRGRNAGAHERGLMADSPNRSGDPNR
jgi:hypothetical protein